MNELFEAASRASSRGGSPRLHFSQDRDDLSNEVSPDKSLNDDKELMNSDLRSVEIAVSSVDNGRGTGTTSPVQFLNPQQDDGSPSGMPITINSVEQKLQQISAFEEPKIRLEDAKEGIQNKKQKLRLMQDQVKKLLKRRNGYMKELFKVEFDKHSYSVIVLKGVLNHEELVAERAKFKKQNPSSKPGQTFHTKHLKEQSASYLKCFRDQVKARDKRYDKYLQTLRTVKPQTRRHTVTSMHAVERNMLSGAPRSMA